MRDSLIKEELLSSANLLKNRVDNLVSLQEEFRNVTREIGAEGHDLGGDLGDFSRGILENEINANLTRLNEYVTQLRLAIESTAATYEEETNLGQSLMDQIK